MVDASKPSAAKPKATRKDAPVVIRPLAKKARRKSRHFERAVDQYASTIGFTVRSEDISSATDLLGGLGAGLGGGAAGGDSDILYAFIRSQPLVAAIDAQLDLRSLYATLRQRMQSASQRQFLTKAAR